MKRRRNVRVIMVIFCVLLLIAAVLFMPFESDATKVGKCVPSSCFGGSPHTICTSDCNGVIRTNLFEIIVYHINKICVDEILCKIR